MHPSLEATRDDMKRVLAFLEKHPDKHYTTKQIANYLNLPEWTVNRYAEMLLKFNYIHWEGDCAH